MSILNRKIIQIFGLNIFIWLPLVTLISGCVAMLPQQQPAFTTYNFNSPYQQLLYSGCIDGMKNFYASQNKEITPQYAQFTRKYCSCAATNNDIAKIITQSLTEPGQPFDDSKYFPSMESHAKFNELKAKMGKIAAKECLGLNIGAN